jgi:hypothetical protein
MQVIAAQLTMDWTQPTLSTQWNPGLQMAVAHVAL